LRDKTHGNFVSDRWKPADSGALSVSLQKNAEFWTVEASTGNLPASRPVDNPQLKKLECAAYPWNKAGDFDLLKIATI
jgi:hypothetical protein